MLIKHSDLERLVKAFERSLNMMEVATTFIEFHGRESEQRDNSVKLLRKTAEQLRPVLAEYEFITHPKD